MPLALLLVILAAGSRLIALSIPEFNNFSPLMALAFCSAVYFRERGLWRAPFLALSLSDLYLDHYYAIHYHYVWSMVGAITRICCFGLSVGLGMVVGWRKNLLNLFSGALGGSIFFYLATNSVCWVSDSYYARSVAGWWQAMTTGHPEFPPTLFFFRNTLVSDLLFAGIFVFAMEYTAFRRGQTSLLPSSRFTSNV